MMIDGREVITKKYSKKDYIKYSKKYEKPVFGDFRKIDFSKFLNKEDKNE